MNNFFTKRFKSAACLADKAIAEVSNTFSLIKENVNGLPLFLSAERTDTFGAVQYDERHYFVIPYRLSKINIALHSMRSLPTGIAEINALPKRRVFHFANEHAEALVKQILLAEAKETAQETHDANSHSLVELANNIDAQDTKLTCGMLFIGGLAAFVNPVVGVGIAAQAVIPGLLNKYGIRAVGEKLSQSQLNKKIQEAEANVLKEFESASTIRVINPILQELELALNTTEKEHDPLIDFDMSEGRIEQLDGERWRELTATAIYHVYREVIEDSGKHADACLGPEDIRWLRVILSNKTE